MREERRTNKGRRSYSANGSWRLSFAIYKYCQLFLTCHHSQLFLCLLKTSRREVDLRDNISSFRETRLFCVEGQVPSNCMWQVSIALHIQGTWLRSDMYSELSDAFRSCFVTNLSLHVRAYPLY